MNLLMITLCIFLKAIVIITAGRLTTNNPQQLYAATVPVKTSPISTSTSTYSPPTLSHHYHSTTLRNTRLSKSLFNCAHNADTRIQAQEDGHFHDISPDQETLEARGSYNYTDNENNTFKVSYIANEKGFQPQGTHLPTVPSLIQRALRYIDEHPEENAE